MPIRFRCVYCEQLLGIARRKASTVVRCPGCGGQLLVPEPDATNSTDDPPPSTDAGPEPPEPEAAPPTKRVTTGPSMFERDDMDDLLRPTAPVQTLESRRSPPRPIGPDGTVSSVPDGPAIAAQALPPPATPQTGIVLSPMTATLLSVFAVVALSLAFAAGLFTGLALRQAAGGSP